jgi:CspA family cold shock protein
MSASSSNLNDARLVGRVKWFNNKSGFGFITVCEGDHKDKDIFVHYSSIRAESQQYRYLVQGEYIEFVLIKSDSENHEFHASDVSGIKEGILMCETHRQNNTNVVRTQYGNRTRVRGSFREESGDYGSNQPTQSVSMDGEGFSEVRRRKKTTSASATG